MNLREYEQNKFQVAELLRSASRIVPEQDVPLREHLQDLLARLAEDRFNLVVVGRFNRGKTSLMNAILGSDRLPIGIIPLTSVITAVSYGSKERVVLKYQNRTLDSEVSIDELPRHVTQHGNPGNVQRIRMAEVQLPAEILRRGFYFVDTPGLGSVIVDNTLTTEAFLPEADAFILVTSYESPLSEDEARFFKIASHIRGRIFVVINKQDAVSIEQRQAALDFVRQQLQEYFGEATPPIFSVSSTDALHAKLSGNDAHLATTGIPELERALVNFLTAEKRDEFLMRMCDRVEKFLWELPRSAEVKTLLGQLVQLSRRFRAECEADPVPATEPSNIFSGLHRVRACEICSKVADRLWDFMCKYQYELIISREERQRFVVRGGLCPFHAWQMQAAASPYGTCSGYPPLLDQLACELRELSLVQLREIRSEIWSLVSGKHCILCEVRSRAEAEALESTAQRLAEHAQAVNSLSAICIPHLAMLVALVQDRDLVRIILKRQATLLERYSEDMTRYALKHDALRRYLASDEETAVAERGLLAVAGRRQVNVLSRMRFAAGVEASGPRDLVEFEDR
jgi:GTP-binding protein EngB required for normal cell division